ncbi:rhamnose/proton symporter RhaT [Granulicella sp. WH15]|uniref:L-rhamnose/proton symporter RhaT n=1 Tax=Granulicella sp. WH15 TaxID=2602070 RepID=UPI0013674FD1|nr:L-rhamnose/proton symporter RhaT [Granulicella sp. WH15]QHN03315.1 rhamnose/proton symporter RhaT [Granulicella sp. WH15]
MNPNPFLGVLFHWLGGLASASNFIPFRGIKRWSWEIYWIIQGVAAWLIAPVVMAVLLVPNLTHILRSAPSATVGTAVFWGMLWGVGGLTFGLAIRYLGLGLGYAIALGFCTAFGTLIPPISHGQMGMILHDRSGQVILLGVAMCLLAIAVSGAAGYSKELEITDELKAEGGERDFSFVKGLAVAVFAGIMSSFFAVGLDAGKPIGDLARLELVANHKSELWQNLPVLIVVLWGGFATNLVWSVILILRNRSGAQFIGQPGSNPLGTATTTGDTLMDVDFTSYTQRIAGGVLLRNYVLAAMAGIIWYFQFFFYSMGSTKMGKYDFASWTLHMASIIIFATLWGIALREWKGTSLRTRVLVGCGLALLVGSTVVVGYGSYLKVR